MSNIFNPNSKFTHYANKFSDLVTLNLWFVITSIPVLTIGAAATSMHYVLLKIYRDELELSVTKYYFHAFKSNFLQSTIIWFVYLLFATIIIVDLHLVSLNLLANPLFIKILLFAVGLLLLFSLNWVFPLQSRYTNPVHATIRNAIVISIMHPIDTVLMCVMLFLPMLLLIRQPSTIPIVLICGFSLSWIVRTIFYSRIFLRKEAN